MQPAECVNPEKTVPKAITQCLYPADSAGLHRSDFRRSDIDSLHRPRICSMQTFDNVAVSPFTIIFEKSGIAMAASVMNAVILTSILSCGNSTLYSASRLLYSMSESGKSPKFLGKVSKSGVPVFAVFFTALTACLCFLTSLDSDSAVYTWLYNATGLTGFLTWFGVCICHLRFRKGFKVQGKRPGRTEVQEQIISFRLLVFAHHLHGGYFGSGLLCLYFFRGRLVRSAGSLYRPADLYRPVCDPQDREKDQDYTCGQDGFVKEPDSAGWAAKSRVKTKRRLG